MNVCVLRLAIVSVLVAIVSLLPTSSPQAAGSPNDLVNAVNALRASYGLAPYSINSVLMATAQGHADYMAITGRVSHTGIGGSSVTDRILSLGYPLSGDLSLGGFRSENITSGSEEMTAQEAVNRWTKDTLHLNTMISPDLMEIGAGVSINNGRVYYVIDCARPTDNGIPQEINPPGPGAQVGPTLPPGVSGVIIPVVVVTPNLDGEVIHDVQAGQTLWQLAISYDTKIDEIKRLNNLFDNEIYPGTRLLIKKDVFLSTATPKETSATDIALSPTRQPTVVTTVDVSTPTSVPVFGTAIAAIAIISVAILGGGMFALWGAKKRL